MKLEFLTLPWQAEAYEDQRSVIAAIGGVGSGKSYWGADATIEDACRWPKAHHFYIGSAKPSMRDGTTQTLLDRLEAWKLRYDWSRSTLDVTIKSGPGKGARIVALSAETYKRWKGLLIDRAWCDEAQAWLDGGDLSGAMAYDFLLTRMRPSEAAQRYYPGLMPRIRVTANPPHRTAHWLYQKFVKNSSGKLYHPTVFDNPLLPMPVEDYIKPLRDSMSKEVFAIEVMGEWGDIGVGRVYTSFSDRNMGTSLVMPDGRTIELEYDQAKPLRMTNDFGVNPRVALEFQIVVLPKKIPGYQREIVVVFDEYTIPNGSTYELIGEFTRRRPPTEVSSLVLHGDPAGQTRNSTTGLSDWAMMQDDPRMQAYRGQIDRGAAAPLIVDRTNAMNAKLCNASGDIGVIIHPKCTNLRDDFQRTAWKEGTRQLDHGTPAKGLQRTHWSDALGYPVERLWPLPSSGARVIGNGWMAR